ncbi:uncharacterized protein LOC105692665 isoform X2 [Athalia rosae]|uniref:uncharacterized protein LOC105692665 isoform X2 n=1 Tax=Athalia rosae TaxID=37344 RepID=UPI0020343B59|nr:uncharacterized protein LOC105692665 isoform X2 [Athalia rosae]XP_048512657.1 uncharacterized protein LOC105692665 isoform X2 [Athalia rosae]
MGTQFSIPIGFQSVITVPSSSQYLFNFQPRRAGVAWHCTIRLQIHLYWNRMERRGSLERLVDVLICLHRAMGIYQKERRNITCTILVTI